MDTSNMIHQADLKQLIEALAPGLEERLRGALRGPSCGTGCNGNCGGACGKQQPCGMNTRLSQWELDELTAQVSATVQFGTLPPGSTTLVVVPPYAIPYKIAEFVATTQMAPGGNQAAIRHRILHAGRTIFEWRGNQWNTTSCCNILGMFKNGLCFGYESEWSWEITHQGAPGDPIMERSDLTYTRCYAESK